MAIVKCTQIKGLADRADYTCEPSISQHPDLHPLTLFQTERQISSCGPSNSHFPDICISAHLTNQLPSIEADVVMIASCIPTLQPLLELIMGKRTLGSYSHSDKYKQSGSNFNMGTFDRSKRSAARKDDLAVTNVEGKESQESILRDDQLQQDKEFPMGAIRRTDNVTVEYEPRSPSTQGHHTEGSW